MTRGQAAGGLTRRAVLEGAAAAGAASLIGPAQGLAATLVGSPALSSRGVGALDGVSRELAAPRRFALVGVQWAAPARAAIELRTRSLGGGWSRWVPAAVLGHGPDAPTADGSMFGAGIWAGSADFVQVRSGHAVAGVRLHFVSTTLPPASLAAASLPLASPALDAGPGQPPIIARAAWAHGQAPPRMTPAYGTVRLAIVHHTEDSNGYRRAEVPALLLAMFSYHRYVLGWNDIGYNFVIDAFGRIWEARGGGIDQAVIGAQAGGYNAVSTGVAVLGSFTSVTPSPAAVRALQQLLAWKLSLHGVPAHGHVTVEVQPNDAFYTPFAPGARVSLPRVAGHRDGDSTACPGDAFYGELPSIRPQIVELAGTPATVTLSARPSTMTAGRPVALSGQLAVLGGGPLAAAPVEVQQLTPGGAFTFATARTAGDGSFAAGLAPVSNVLVRALHRPAPATASDLVEISVAPRITLSIDTLSLLRVSGSVSPVKRSVTIDVFKFAGAGGRRRRVGRKRLTVNGGRFAGRIPTHGPGRYVLVARTVADARNAGGSSVPVGVTI